MVDEFTSNMTLSGQQSVVQQITWIPNMSHSVLDDQGVLSGGIQLIGMVDGGLADDSQDNNQLTRLMPVAIWHDSICLLYTSPSPRDATLSRMPSSA